MPRTERDFGAWHVPLPLVAYASRTGTRQNLAALRAAGWGLMVSARGVLRTEGFDTYALDNGAWTSFQRGEAFDESAFQLAVDKLGERADFIVVPDIVAGGLRSLDFSLTWLERLRGVSTPMAFAVQDGMTPAMVEPYIGAGRSKAGYLFVGGSTEWKLATMSQWVELGRRKHAGIHVGRVNTVRRIKACLGAGATSFDGSGPSRYVLALRRLDDVRRTADLFSTPAVSTWVPKCDASKAVFDYFDLGNEAHYAAHE